MKRLLPLTKCFREIQNIKTLRATNTMKYSLNNYSTLSTEPVLSTVQDVKETVMKKMGIQNGYTPIPIDRTHLLKNLPKEHELPERHMKDSFLVCIIPLSKDQKMQDKYITFLGQVRIGRLLEDMDLFAVMVAQKHIKITSLPEDEPAPFTLVTAHVDQIDFTDFVSKPNEDIKISGVVSWVGKSSMEVVVWLEQELHGSWHLITRALFLIAARDPTNKKAARVNSLIPENDIEKEIFMGGESRKKNRINSYTQHVSKVIPTMDEQQIIHDLYIANSKKTNVMRSPAPNGRTIPMENCVIHNVIFSHPEDRNLHNTVFGGFIMRNATELAWILGYKFCKYRPFLRHISDISFDQPIAVNSLIQMQGHVTYTKQQYYQVVIIVETFDPITGEIHKKNTLHFTFESRDEVLQVYPQSYHEAMLYVDGRRHLDAVIKDRGSKMESIIDKYVATWTPTSKL